MQSYPSRLKRYEIMQLSFSVSDKDRGFGVLSNIAMHPAGELFAVAYSDGIVLHSLSPDGKCDFIATKAKIKSLSWSPDGIHLAGGADEEIVQIWDTRNNLPIRIPKTLTPLGSDPIVAWSPNGLYLAGTSRRGKRLADKVIEIWDVRNYKIVRSISSYGPVLRLAWSPDSTQLINVSVMVGDADIQTYDINTGERRYLEGVIDIGGAPNVAWSPDGMEIIGTFYEKPTLRIWNAHDLQLLRTLDSIPSGFLSTASWSPDGAYIVGGSSYGPIYIWEAQNIRNGDFSRGNSKSPRVFKGHKGMVFSVAWSPDGAYLVSASLDGTVRVWDMTL